MKKTLFLSVLMIAVFAIAGSASAQSDDENAILTDDKGINLQNFHPSIFGGDYLGIEDSDTLCPWRFGGGLYYSYANSVFTWFEDEEPQYDFISELHSGHLNVAFGTFSFLSIGAEIPAFMARYRPTEDFGKVEGLPELETKTFMGDVRAEMKIRLLQKEKHFIGWALAPYVNFPTGDKESLLSDGRTTGGGTMILDADLYLFNLALNGGYLYRDWGEVLGVDVGNAWKYGAGISRSYKSGFQWSIEYWGSSYYIDRNENNIDREILKNNPMEVLMTLRYSFGANGPRLIGGGGVGATDGLGAPVYRIVGGVDYYCRECAPAEGELTVQTVDQNDKPLSAKVEIAGVENRSGTTAADGKWASKVKAGDYKADASKDGYQAASSSFAIQKGKGLLVTLKLVEIPKPKTFAAFGATDKCSKEKLSGSVTLESAAGKQILALKDGAVEQEVTPGLYKVTVAVAGYPAKTAEVNVVKETKTKFDFTLIKKIELKDKIFFKVNSDVILPKSFGALDDVVAQVKSLCEFKKVVIEGHTSSEGSDEKNMVLSQKRAQSVLSYLVKHGIDAAKLEALGFGETKPIASNDTPDGREMNRRVEFNIVE